MNIYVANLSYQIKDEDLSQIFEEFGEVSSAKVIVDKYNGRSRGFGFVEMPNNEEANQAIKSLNNKEFLGKAISVNEARPRTEGGNRDRGGDRGGDRGDRRNFKRRY